MIKIFDILLELENKSKNLPFSVNQNDLNAIRINMTILKDGIPLTIAGATSARIAIKKPSGLSVIQDCEIVDSSKGKISVILSTQAYAEVGKHDAEIYLYEGEVVSVTSTFSYTSKKAILDNGTVTSTNDWQSINNALIQIDDGINRIENADVYTKSEADVKLTGKVDTVAGKSLSTNDYNNTEKAEVAKVKDKADKTYVDNGLLNKVDKVAGKGLSTNDYDNTEKSEVSKVKDKADKTYVDIQLADKAPKKKTDTWVDVVADFGAKGDGVTDDTVAIQNAINSLQKGNVLIIPKGTFMISEALSFKNLINITIELNGNLKSTKHGYCGIEIENCKYVVVQGSGTIEGYGSFPSQSFSGSPLRVSNEKTRNGGGFATNRKNGTVGTTAFGGGWEGNTGFGILVFNGSENILIKDIEITGFNYSGIGAGWLNASTYNKNISILGVTIHDCQNSGIDGSKTIGLTIDDCTIFNIGHPSTTINDTEINLGYGFANVFSNSCAENVMIRNNRFYSCTRKAVDFHAVKGNASVIGNEIKDCFIYGIATPHNSSTVVWDRLEVSHNRIINCGNALNTLPSIEYPAGILFEASFGGILSHNIIIGNKLRGIDVVCKSMGQTKPPIYTISNNHVYSTDSTVTYACYVESSNPDVIFNISNNVFRTDYGRAFYIFSTTTNNTIANISGNTCVSDDTNPSTGYALQVYQVSNGSISNNTCIGNTALHTNSVGTMKRNAMNTLIGTVSSAIPIT